MATDFPPDAPVSIATFYLVKNDTWNSRSDYDPMPAIIEAMQEETFVSRVVPIPKILTPEQLTFDSIQQIGLRSLSEYSVLLYGDAEKSFFSYLNPCPFSCKLLIHNS